MPKIITEPVFPPIPTGRFDWRSYIEGREEKPGEYGYGRTAEESLQELELITSIPCLCCGGDEFDKSECVTCGPVDQCSDCGAWLPLVDLAEVTDRSAGTKDLYCHSCGAALVRVA